MNSLNIDKFDFIPYKINHGYVNMALDEVIYSSIKNSSRKAVFRLYGWIKPSITIGYFQKIHDLNLTNCINNNIPVIRRITGGRAVLHTNEITYSMSIKANKPITNKKEVFYELSKIIINGLNALGINASINPKIKGNHKNPNCFNTTSVHEIINEHKQK